MTVQQLQKVHRAQPFRPFRIRMADGDHVDVRHPDFLAHSPSGRTVIVTHDDDDYEVLDVLMITRLEVLNGRTTARRR